MISTGPARQTVISLSVQHVENFIVQISTNPPKQQQQQTNKQQQQKLMNVKLWMLVIYVLIERYLYSIHTCQPIWFTSIK